MLPPDASENALRSFFRKHTIAEISELFRLLETRSRMSVFRRLKAMGYRSSFNHAGRYYTLTNVPRFDQWGLWFHGNVGFSCAGTLKATVVELVESSATGMTPKELLALLKLPVANTLYNTLHELRQGARIRRQDLAGFHLYLSANLGRADEQLLKRRQELSQEVQVSEETVIAVLVEALQSAQVLEAPSVLASRLTARGVGVTAVQVEQIFTRYGLVAEKKNGGLTLETVAQLRAMIHAVGHRCRQQILWSTDTCLSADEKPGICPVCGGERWYVQKTRVRHGRTLAHGQFEARETVRVCASGCHHASGLLVTRGAGSLTKHLPPSSVVGYDVMVRVGLERFLRHRQRHEICSTIENEEGIRISTGEVSELSRRFVHYLARLHQARADRLKAALESDGGWPMHVDATGEDGRGTLLLVMAGWRQWVLGAWKISTERADLILPCLRETVRHFGTPCAVMRDLGRAMTPAIDDLVCESELSIPVLACHQHFLADVGKDLLEPSYAKLRGLFRRTKVRPKLRALVRDLGRKLGPCIEDARKAVRQWQSMAERGHGIESGDDGLAIVRAVAQWTLDYKAQASGLDYPFDRPYLDLYERCSSALRATDAFLRNPSEDKKVNSALERLHRYLAPVDCEVPFRQTTERLRRRAALFDELRGVLRLAGIPQKDETEQDLNRMRERLDELVASLKKRRPERGPAQDIREAIDIVLKHIDVHGANLWGHAIRLPERAGGGVKLVFRTNFPAENFFGEFKHDERRRSGRKNLTQDLEQLPAEAVLVYNLEHADYVALVCGSLDRLAEAFAHLDFDQHEKRLRGLPSGDRQQDLRSEIQLASASLSTADRRVIRTEEMDRRIAAAARSRAPYHRH